MKNKVEALDQLYDGKLKTLLKPLEERRRSYVKQFLLSVLILSGVMIGCLLYLPVANYLAGIVVLVIGSYLIWHSYKAFRPTFANDFKREIITQLIELIDKKLKYIPDAGITKEVFVRSGLFPGKIAMYSAEDWVEGSIGGTAICFSEIHAQTATKDPGSHTETRHDLFKGLFFTAAFNKQFSSGLFIYPDYFGGRFSKIQESLLRGMLGKDRVEIIRLEDPKFEQHFSVFGTDQVDARYILSPALMERLLALREKYKYFAVSFIDNQIYIAFHLNKNLFEPRILRSVINKKQLEEYLNYSMLMIEIVDDLKLNYHFRD